MVGEGEVVEEFLLKQLKKEVSKRTNGSQGGGVLEGVNEILTIHKMFH